MKRYLAIMVAILGLTWAYSAKADVTITVTDGVETHTINLNETQSEKLDTAMAYMGAKKYRLHNKIDPIVESGNTELQQLKQVIIEIVKGIYFQVEDDEIDLEAETKKKELEFTSSVVVKDTKFVGLE